MDPNLNEMKILYLSPSIPFPSDAGGKLRTAAILNALAKNNDVYFLALHDPDSSADYEELKRYVKDFKVVIHKRFFGCKDSLYKKILKVLYLTLGIPSPVIRDLSLEFESLVKSYVKKLEPDLVVVDLLWLTQYIKPLKGKFRKILNTHNVESDVFRTTRRGLVFWLPWKIWERYESKTVRNFDLVFVTSENEKKRFSELYSAGNYMVVPNAINTKLFKFNQYVRRNGLVFTGNLSYLPNVDAIYFFVEKILPLIKKKKPEVQLSIVGSNPSSKVLAFDEVPGVKVFANVPDIKPYTSNAAVAVVPLRSGAGTRLKILEAFALGTPVVSTSFGSEGLAVEPGKDLLIEDDISNFSNAILSLLNNQKLSEKITMNARKTVEEKYSWEAVEQAVNKIIPSVR